ncbi:alpha/beta fold hydrolase [Nocardia sp. NPDC003693]
MGTDVAVRMSEFRRGELVFPVIDSGPLDGEPVLLLHGWPQDSRSWDAVAPLLHAAGYRTFAPDLRGSVASAAPRWRWQYRLGELAGDVAAMIEQIGRPVHLVGHDWGAALAWVVAGSGQGGLKSMAALSIPHPGAFARAVLTSRQVVASWYMYAFQVPLLPELTLRTGIFRRILGDLGQTDEHIRRDSDRVRDRAIARGGLHWYRAMLLSSPRVLTARVAVPTLQIWSSGDQAVLESGVRLTERFVDGPFRLEILPGVSHWIPEEAPEDTARLLVEHFESAGAAAR